MSLSYRRKSGKSSNWFSLWWNVGRQWVNALQSIFNSFQEFWKVSRKYVTDFDGSIIYIFCIINVSLFSYIFWHFKVKRHIKLLYIYIYIYIKFLKQDKTILVHLSNIFHGPFLQMFFFKKASLIVNLKPKLRKLYCKTLKVFTYLITLLYSLVTLAYNWEMKKTWVNNNNLSFF